MEGITAAMQGHIDGYFATVSLVHTQRDNPKIKVLAVTSERTNRFLPHVRTFSESGIKDMVMTTLFGIAIRATTPADIKARVTQAVTKVVNSDAMKQARQSLSLDDFGGSVQEYQREADANLRMYVEAAKKAAPHKTN